MIDFVLRLIIGADRSTLLAAGVSLAGAFSVELVSTRVFLFLHFLSLRE